MQWYWIYARLANGKIGLFGPCQDYQAACNIAYAKCPDCDWEVIMLPTRDPTRAGQIIRARRLRDEYGTTLTDVMEPIRHK